MAPFPSPFPWQLPEVERKRLRGGDYLWLLEPFLNGERRASDAQPFGVENFLVLLVNLTGGDLPPDAVQRYAPGLIPVSLGGGGGGGGGGNAHVVRAGNVMVLETPPSGRLVGVGSGVPTLVVLFPPGEPAEQKWHKMWGACLGLESRFPQLQGKVLVEPPVDEWKAIVSALAAAGVPCVELGPCAPWSGLGAPHACGARGHAGTRTRGARGRARENKSRQKLNAPRRPSRGDGKALYVRGRRACGVASV